MNNDRLQRNTITESLNNKNVNWHRIYYRLLFFECSISISLPSQLWFTCWSLKLAIVIALMMWLYNMIDKSVYCQRPIRCRHCCKLQQTFDALFAHNFLHFLLLFSGETRPEVVHLCLLVFVTCMVNWSTHTRWMSFE